MFAKKSISAATALPNAKNIKAFLHPTSNRISLFCDLQENHGASSSGKTITIASSGGNKPLGSSNANIGLNVFCKNLESLDLSDKAIGALANLSEVTPGLEWQVVDKHLHFLLDFDKTQPRVAKSEKSTLLMSSSGFKRVGATGISVNMNCYIKTGVTFNPEGLKTFAEVPIQIPENVTVEVSEDGQSLLITADLSDVEVDGMTSIPSVSIGEGLTVNVHIKKVSPSSSTAQAQKSPSKASKKAATFVPVGDSTSVSVSGAGTDNVQFKLDLQDLGFSSTGKTLLRASSKGFQQVVNLRVNAIVYSKDIKPALKEIISKFLATKEDPLTVELKSELRPAVQAAMGVSELTDEVKDAIKEIAKELLSVKRPRSEEGKK